MSTASKAGFGIGVLLLLGVVAGSVYFVFSWLRRRKMASTESSPEVAVRMNRRYSTVQELEGRGWESRNLNYGQHYRIDSAQSSWRGSEKWAVELDGTGVR